MKLTCRHETRHRGQTGQKFGKLDSRSEDYKEYSKVNIEKESPKQQQKTKGRDE